MWLPRYKLIQCPAIAFVLLFSPVAQGDVLWKVNSGDWSDATNWNGGLPTLGVFADIINGGTVQVTKPGAIALDLFVGPGTIDQLGGDLTVGGVLVDWNAPLTMRVSGGTFACDIAYYTGTINQTGGTCKFLPLPVGNGSNNYGLWIGGGRGPGSYSITSGTLEAYGLAIGATAGSPGTMTVSDSNGAGNTSVSVTGVGADVGGGAPGTLNMSGGLFQVLGGDLSVGTSAVAPGTLNQTGGIVNCRGLKFGRSFNSSGTYNLSGGTLIVQSIGYGVFGTGSFNFNGGTLKAAASFSNPVPIALNNNGGDATIDTDANSVTFASALSGQGNLIKEGSGSLILNAMNTYTGPTTVRAGVLQIGGSLTSAVSVENDATLSGTGSLGAVTVKAGGKLAPGSASGSIGTITLNGGLAFNDNATADFDLGSTSASDFISMPSAILILGSPELSDFHFTTQSGFGPGIYTLVHAQAIEGNLGTNVTGTIGGLDASISKSGSELQLVVVPEPSSLILFCVGVSSLIGFQIASRMRLGPRDGLGRTIEGIEPDDHSIS